MNNRIVWACFTCTVISCAFAVFGALINSAIISGVGVISAIIMTIVTIRNATEYGIVRTSKQDGNGGKE